jgi:subfamily B ATP-binding cassette protein MsbA
MVPGEKRPATSRELYSRLLSHVWPYRAAIAGGIVAMIVGGLADAAIVKLVGPLIDELFVHRNANLAVLLPLGIVAVFLVSGIASFAAGYSTQYVAQRVILDLRRAMFAKLMRLPPAYFDEAATASLVTRFTNDVNNLAGASTTVLTVVVRDTVTIVALLAILLHSNWKLTLVTFVVIPPIAVVVRMFSRRLRTMSRESQRAVGGIAEVLDESIANQRVVRVFGGQDYEMRRFEEAGQRLRRYSMKHAAAASGTVPVTQLLVACAIAAIVYLAAGQAFSGSTDVGHFIEFIGAMGLILQPLKRLTGVNEHLQRGLAACESVFDLVDTQEEDDRGTVEIERAQGAIRFDRVSLSYASGTRPALEDVSLEIRPGETVALVGASGSGKSSLIHLLPRFYHPQSGRITLDGHDLESLRLASLRRQISLVSQNVVLFNDTVAANIAYGRAESTPEEAIRPRRAGRARAGFHRGSAAGPRHADRRERREAFGRPTPAHRDRARDPQGCAGAAARRGDVGTGYGKRARGAGRARGADEGPHDHRHRASAVDHRERRSHRGPVAGPHPGSGLARAIAGIRGRVRGLAPAAVRPHLTGVNCNAV